MCRVRLRQAGQQCLDVREARLTKSVIIDRRAERFEHQSEAFKQPGKRWRDDSTDFCDAPVSRQSSHGTDETHADVRHESSSIGVRETRYVRVEFLTGAASEAL